MSEIINADLNVIRNTPIEIELLDGDLNIIQALDDEPNDVQGLTSAQLKAKFDQAGLTIQRYINETLIPAIESGEVQLEQRITQVNARVFAAQFDVTSYEEILAACEAGAAVFCCYAESLYGSKPNVFHLACCDAENHRFLFHCIDRTRPALPMLLTLGVQKVGGETSWVHYDALKLLTPADAGAVFPTLVGGKVPAAQLPAAQGAVPLEEKGAANGVATLGADGKVPEAQLPAGGSGLRYATRVVGTTAAGWTAADCDYLCDGVDDQVEIQAALDDMESGGTLLLLRGTYFIQAQINVEHDNVTVCGESAECVTLLRAYAPAVSVTGMVMVSAANLTIRDICLDGGNYNAYNYDGHTLVCTATSGAAYLTLRCCTMTNTKYCVRFQCPNGRVDNCLISSTRDNYIVTAIYGSDYTRIVNNRFQGDYSAEEAASGLSTGVSGNALGIVVEGNHFIGCSTAISGSAGSGTVIDGNVFWTCETAITGSMKQSTISNNTIRRGDVETEVTVTTGIKITANGNSNTVIGNTIADMDNGITVFGSRQVISGNTVGLCDLESLSDAVTIVLKSQSRNCLVTNNILSAAVSEGGTGNTVSGNVVA